MNIYQQTSIKPQWLGIALFSILIGVLATVSFKDSNNQLDQNQVTLANQILFGNQAPFGDQMSLINEAYEDDVFSLLAKCHPTEPCYRFGNNCIYVWGPKVFQHCS
jgi:hypothetical protein